MPSATTMSLDELPPPLPQAHAEQHHVAQAVAAVPPPPPGIPVIDSPGVEALLEAVHQLQAGQSHQTDLISKLHKTVLTSRSMINELVVANNELKEELSKMKKSAQCDGCKKKEAAFVAQTMLSVAGEIHRQYGRRAITEFSAGSL